MPQQPSALRREYTDAFALLGPDYDLSKAEGTNDLAAWFLGPLGENGKVFKGLIDAALASHLADRASVYPHDPVYVTDAMKQAKTYTQSVEAMHKALEELLGRLRGSVPQYSYRHQGHMLWDMTLPGLAGYFAGMLYNQNNVAAEASPVTTLLENAVGKSLCQLMGYRTGTADEKNGTYSWGHIACDGTVANLEAMWSARNLKYYPVALARAIANEDGLAKARGIEITDGRGQQRKLLGLTDWALINLPADVVLTIPAALRKLVPDVAALERVNAYTLQELGFGRFCGEMLDKQIRPPVVLAPATMHYSWPKAASILGIGQSNLLSVQVDSDARAKLSHREEILARCKKEMRPVLMDVAVIGSTELSSVDPLDGIVKLRDAHAKEGFFYPVHADAAWGGYFASLLREAKGPLTTDKVARAVSTPDLSMSAYVQAQYEALPRTDSVTVDPHKAGFIPYPAGGLCYRNPAQRDMVAFTLRYLVHSEEDPSVGIYSVEGSKPGAAAASVYLSHQVIPPDQQGYGRILGQCLFNSKRLYAAIVTMNHTTALTDGKPAYRVTPVQWLPAEKSHGDVQEQIKQIHDLIVTKTNAAIVASPEATKLMAELGSDQVIIGYAFNPYINGTLNTDPAVANKLNQAIYDKLSVKPAQAAARDPQNFAPPELVLMASSFTEQTYGRDFVTSFADRMGLALPDEASLESIPDLSYLLSTTMDPWMSDTSQGDFTPQVVKHLDATVREAITRL
ncbi:pyridoxal-dependent decarboxylase [Streptomyces sp. HSW2009]|uniref:pyridoxal phosphate-dependent decarboxylase family protein n=1 Tax=Streptomyces sp. HSW2009 TaxID=3142890 RepID=UPI0032EE01D8